MTIAKTGSDKVDIIAHSMGGLLVRTYIQNKSNTEYRSDINNFAMVGTPNQGSVNAYYLWYSGNPKYTDDINETGLYNLVNFYSYTTVLMNKSLLLYAALNPLCTALYAHYFCLDTIFSNPLAQKQTRKYYQEHVTSAKILLPVFDFLSGSKTGSIADNNVLKDMNNNFNLNGVNAMIFAGNDQTTINNVPVGSPNSMYPYGVPKGSPGTSSSGDGTVLVERTKVGSVPYDPSMSSAHSGLIKTYRDRILDFIGVSGSASTSRSFLMDASTSAPVLSISVHGSVTPYLTDPYGKKIGINPATGALENETSGGTVNMDSGSGNISIESPLTGTYTVQLKSGLSRDYSVEISYGDTDVNNLLMIKGFNDAKITSFSFSLDKNSSDIITILSTPQPPTDVQADIINGTLKTQLSWTPSTDSDVTGYRIYGSKADEPFLSLLGTSTIPLFDTGHDWASTSAIPAWIYAVSAVKANGTESFLSNLATNNDSDHDSLIDEDETAFGSDMTNPDTDGDGLLDGEEYIHGTSPVMADTDGDGYSDYNEVQKGSDPLDPGSIPSTILSTTISNSIGPRNTIKISDMSGTLSAAGNTISVLAWDVNGNALPESGAAAPLKLYSHGTTGISGADLAARFPSGTPMLYKFPIDAS